MKIWLVTIENNEDSLVSRVSAVSMEEATSKVEVILESWDGWKLLTIVEEAIDFSAPAE